jgi:hypothetical protein
VGWPCATYEGAAPVGWRVASWTRGRVTLHGWAATLQRWVAAWTRGGGGEGSGGRRGRRGAAEQRCAERARRGTVAGGGTSGVETGTHAARGIRADRAARCRNSADGPPRPTAWPPAPNVVHAEAVFGERLPGSAPLGHAARAYRAADDSPGRLAPGSTRIDPPPGSSGMSTRPSDSRRGPGARSPAPIRQSAGAWCSVTHADPTAGGGPVLGHPRRSDGHRGPGAPSTPRIRQSAGPGAPGAPRSDSRRGPGAPWDPSIRQSAGARCSPGAP